MALRGFVFLLASSVLGLASFHPLHAQGPLAVGFSGVDLYANRSHVEAAPYVANRKTTRVQKLADGTTITHEGVGKEARDSAGRTYVYYHSEIPEGGDESGGFFNVHIVDPVTRTNINWSSNSKEATVIHMPEPIRTMQAPAPPLRPAPTAQVRPPLSNQPRPDIEKLGTKTVNGVQAEGTRTTRVIPAGRDGNDEPITVVHEHWYSRELKLTVMDFNDDPRTGVATMELSDIEPGEPDPALFQIPEGYTVKERTVGQPN